MGITAIRGRGAVMLALALLAGFIALWLYADSPKVTADQPYVRSAVSELNCDPSDKIMLGTEDAVFTPASTPDAALVLWLARELPAFDAGDFKKVYGDESMGQYKLLQGTNIVAVVEVAKLKDGVSWNLKNYSICESVKARWARG